MRKLIYSFVAIILLGACSSIECPLTNVVYSTYSLKKSIGDADTLLDTLTISTRQRDGKDTILLNKAVTTTTFDLPMSYTGDVDELYFTVGDTNNVSITDTVWVRKANIPHFESVDCTPSYFHEIQEVRHTGHRIESIEISDKDVTYDATTNFNIIFKKRY